MTMRLKTFAAGLLLSACWNGLALASEPGSASPSTPVPGGASDVVPQVSPQAGTAARRASPEANDAYTVDTVVVTGRPIDNYQAVDTLTGVRAATPLRDLPLSISVVSQELIQDRSLNQLGEALDNVAGAQRKAGYGGVQNFGAFLRGFDSSFLTLRNGARDFGFYTLRDTANVERFEILKTSPARPCIPPINMKRSSVWPMNGALAPRRSAPNLGSRPRSCASVCGWAHAETLVSAVELDMTTTWTATAASYFGRVSKGRIAEAVEECVGKPDADRIAGWKKADMAEAAEALVAGKGWLPAALRTAVAQAPEPPKAEDETTAAPSDDDYAFAAE